MKCYSAKPWLLLVIVISLTTMQGQFVYGFAAGDGSPGNTCAKACTTNAAREKQPL